SLRSADREGILCDALSQESVCQTLLSLIAKDEKLQSRYGIIQATSSQLLPELMNDEGTKIPARRSSAEQSNTSILFGDKLIMKCFRKQEFGPNPDTEIGRFFTEQTSFRQIAPFGGSIEYSSDEQQPATLAMLQGLVANEGDGWQWTLEELERYFESC